MEMNYETVKTLISLGQVACRNCVEGLVLTGHYTDTCERCGHSEQVEIWEECECCGGKNWDCKKCKEEQEKIK